MPLHVDNPDYSHVPRPPTNGHHRPIWANWGFYQQPVPYAYEVHNLEHGGIIIHLGLNINARRGHEVLRMWAASPPFMLIVPGLPADVPRHGATITSWQRAMICKKWNPRVLGAIITYRDTYRGHGPGAGAVAQHRHRREGPAEAPCCRTRPPDERRPYAIPRTSTTCSPSRARSPRSTALQLELSAARSQGAVPDTIILCEHPPTLTLGRASDAAAELARRRGRLPRARLGRRCAPTAAGAPPGTGPASSSATPSSTCATTARTCAATRTTSSGS